jgi:hypothetical protein
VRKEFNIDAQTHLPRRAFRYAGGTLHPARPTRRDLAAPHRCVAWLRISAYSREIEKLKEIPVMVTGEKDKLKDRAEVRRW